MLKLLLLAFGALKFGKLLTVGGSMLLSLGVYAVVWGWQFATGFIVMLLLHELGHYAAARQRGLAVGLPTFIPFVGAWIELKEQPVDVETEAYVALAGPAAGTAAALVAYGLSRMYDSPLLLAIAYAGLFLNLINLLPVSPLDGGRITAILSPRVWLLGAPLMVLVFLWSPSPVFILVAVLAIPQLIRAWRYDPQAPENVRYYGVSLQQKIEYGLLYAGLTILLAVMTFEVHDMLASVRQHHGD